MAYNSTLPTTKIEGALLASLKTKKIEYNITQDKSSNYASLAEAIAAVDDDEYKVKGIVLTFYTGTDWVSKRYNGEDASGFADEGNWMDYIKIPEQGTKVEDGGSGSVTKELNPNVFYKFGEVTQLTITLAAGASDVTNEYMFSFDSGAAATNLGLPESVIEPSDFSLKENTHYEINIQDNYMMFKSWDKA